MHSNPPQDVEQTNNIMDTCFATEAYASCAAIHRSLKISPGALAFHRDMILDIPLLADLHALHQRRQVIIDKRLRRANYKRRTYDYQIGQEVLILTDQSDKLQNKGHGPCIITQVHANGTVTIQRTQHVRERINI